MEINRILLSIGAAACVALAAGCQTASTALPPPKSTTVLVLKPQERSVLRTLVPATALKIVLPIPAQGLSYRWEVVSNNNKVLQQTSEVAADKASGAGFAVTFQVLRPGRSVILLAALKPGQAESEPEDLYQVVVGVKSSD